ncbi:UDP-glucose 4-epimerase family protein [Ectothiorhodospira marina]|uniref:Nucleoside-diphosphate-sugar epimerase n=1 Tax=Ectothiorhodospira marina TaxID=1396821 RepID=A0A1H7RKU2_9GAMM|nr:SDR family oxidoreductase [Ectothiorhodospira marina]SEL60715.1 Nucleoside-diphosphate-sugar epimerase [Ectothiorhodospira marina]
MSSGSILVTGTTGFVGFSLINRLQNMDAPLTAAIRRPLPSAPSFHTVPVGDIDGTTQWSPALEDVNTVVHLAARVHVLADDADDPLAAYRQVNVDGTLNLARQAAQAGVRRFVFVSSVKVNGESTAPGVPFSEDDRPAPEDPYGVSKWEAEQGLQALARETGLEVVIIRPPLVYGPGVGANFASLVRWVNKGVPLPLGAVTDNRRSLVALDNLVDFIITCIRHPAAANETFLVSDGEDVSTAGLLRAVAEAQGRPSRLIPVPVWALRAGARALGKEAMAQRLLGSLQVDSGKARELLGWTPPLSLHEGLKRLG